MLLPNVLAASSFVEVRPGLIFWTLVTFIIVAIILRAKAWGPILSLVEEREKQIASSIEAAKRERAEAEKLLAEQKTAIAEARRDAQEMLRRNQQEVEKFREELMAKSRKEAEEFKASATREIEEQKSKAIAEVKAMAVDLSMEIASKLLNERLDDSKHRALAEQFVAGLPVKGTTQGRA
ncbi:ATP synthase F0 subcomplex B subunit [Archangium gephyra]|uniref:ATP synthase subunit b n=1 Tax=Archangium gephyra TaxID=48 RepID=A0AAC8TB66_9BACT|nr:F0F1 ATP synthase subunit B [Archangium gephyra]AKI99641.1 ATP synthase F0 sector subunit b [Archangium gephyra]REG27828.1 ATP synthase F0 subcomplex B subunit [Archangium gephyra]